MTASFDQPLRDAGKLAEDGHLERVLELIDPPVTSEQAAEIEQAWNEEAIRRLAEFDAGATATISSEELHASIKAELLSR